MNNYLKVVAAVLAVLMIAMVFSSCAKKEGPQVVVIEKQELPVVYFRVMVSAGSAFDPDAKAGLACLTAHMLNKGTRSYSREDIESKLDEIGAEVGIAVDKEVIVVTGKTLKENLESFYPIFREIITAPAFPASELKQEKEAQLDRINQIREDDVSLSLAVFENTLFAGYRYGHLVEGIESEVASLTKEDAASFYSSHYLQGNVIAGLAGAVDDSLTARFKRDLLTLPEGSLVRVATPATIEGGKRVVLVEKENRAQSQLQIGHLMDITRKSSDYFALRLLGSYLGEHRELFGRLPVEVRVKRGLAYGAYDYIEYFRQAGWSKLPANGICREEQYFHMWTYPKEVNFEFCIKLMLSEMGKLAAGEIGEKNLDLVKSYVSNSFPFMIETPDKQLGMALDEIWYGTPGFVEDYQAKVQAVNLADVKQVAEKHFHPDDVLIVAVVSDGKAAKDELLSLGTKLELPSGAGENELKSANAEVKGINLGLKSDDIMIVKAVDMFK